jgi:uncharacterized oxidoreductase
MQVSGKKILITGGSSGIGLATAQSLAKKGARLVIAARKSERLEAALASLRKEGASVEAIAADVATSEGREMIVAKVNQTKGGLDILINNAGAVRAGPLEEITEDEIKSMLEINLVAPIMLSRAFLALLRASGDGLIVNVASGIALIGVPYYAVYAATKSGLARFGEALRRELKGEGVHVLTVYPTATETPMMATNKAGPDLGFIREPVEDVAQAIVEGIENAAWEVIRGGENRTKMIALNRENPAAIDERYAKIKPELAIAVRGHSTF